LAVLFSNFGGLHFHHVHHFPFKIQGARHFKIEIVLHWRRPALGPSGLLRKRIRVALPTELRTPDFPLVLVLKSDVAQRIPIAAPRWLFICVGVLVLFWCAVWLNICARVIFDKCLYMW